jgi:hypothetical protein
MFPLSAQNKKMVYANVLSQPLFFSPTNLVRLTTFHLFGHAASHEFVATIF